MGRSTCKVIITARGRRVPGGWGSDASHTAAARWAFDIRRGLLVLRMDRRRKGMERRWGDRGMTLRFEKRCVAEAPEEDEGSGVESAGMLG